MSLAGFMKQINKANQLLSEKIGGAKGTELDENFHKMEKKTDVVNKLVDDLRDKTTEFLQPNPASRAKLWTVNNFSKIRGQVKNTPYPQPEGTLGESMGKFGTELGEDSNFGNALVDMSECLKQMAGIKYALEDNIKQNFLDPLATLRDNELREVMHLRKKMENRRLDFDCKKRKQKPASAINDDELRQASEKFDESKVQAEEAMANLLNNEVEHISHLIGFADGFLEYHMQCCEILKDMCKALNDRKKAVPSHLAKAREASINSKGPETSSASRFYDNGVDTASSISDNSYMDRNELPRNSKVEKQPYPTLPTPVGFKYPSMQQSQSTLPPTPSKFSSPPPPTYQRTVNNNNGNGSKKEPCCRGLYDFDAESHEELEFKEGDIIKLITRLDDNWYEGEVNGRHGRFPVSYVEILVPIPH